MLRTWTFDKASLNVSKVVKKITYSCNLKTKLQLLNHIIQHILLFNLSKNKV